MSKILCVGDVAIEMILPMKSLPPQGGMTSEDHYRFLPGGACGNAAVAISFFGIPTALCARVGRDGNASRLIRFFSENGIDTSAVFTEQQAETALVAVLHEECSGVVRTLSYRGAAEKITAQDFDSALSQSPDAVYLSKEVTAYIAAHAVTLAEEQGIPVYLDASEERLLRALSLKGATVKLLYTAMESVSGFTDMPISDVNTALKATLALAQKIKADYYVIRMPNGGLFLYDGKTYNMVTLSDYARIKPHAAYADVQSAVLTALLFKGGNLYHSVGLAAVADLVAREGKDFRLPTPDACRLYIHKNNLPFSI